MAKAHAEVYNLSPLGEAFLFVKEVETVYEQFLPVLIGEAAPEVNLAILCKGCGPDCVCLNLNDFAGGWKLDLSDGDLLQAALVLLPIDLAVLSGSESIDSAFVVENKCVVRANCNVFDLQSVSEHLAWRL